MNLESPKCEEVMRDEYGRIFVDVEEMAAAAAGGGFQAEYVQKIDGMTSEDADTVDLVGPRVTGRRYVRVGVYYARGLRDGRRVSLLFYLNSRAEAIRMGDLVPVDE